MKETTQELPLTHDEERTVKALLERAEKIVILRPIVFLVFTSLLFLIPTNFLSSAEGQGVYQNVYDMFGVFKPLAWLLLVSGLIFLSSLKEMEYFGLKKDINEGKKIVQTSIVKTTGSYKGEHYVKLMEGKPKILRSHDLNFEHLIGGESIRFEVFKNSKVFIRFV